MRTRGSACIESTTQHQAEEEETTTAAATTAAPAGAQLDQDKTAIGDDDRAVAHSSRANGSTFLPGLGTRTQ